MLEIVIEVRRALLAIPGISQVTVVGGELRQYQVLLDPPALARHGVGVLDVVRALEGADATTAAGFHVDDSQVTQAAVAGAGVDTVLRGVRAFGAKVDVSTLPEDAQRYCRMLETLADAVGHLGHVMPPEMRKPPIINLDTEPPPASAHQQHPAAATGAATVPTPGGGDAIFDPLA